MSIVAPDRHCRVARKSYTETEQKNEDMALAPAWEHLDFLRLTARPFGNQLACADLETPRMRLGFESYEGDFRFRGALKQDALYLAFACGERLRVGGRPHPEPTLGIVGPGSEFDMVQHSRQTRYFLTLRQPAWAGLLAGADADQIAGRWLRPGLHQPGGAEAETRRLHRLMVELAGLLTAPDSALRSDPAALRLAADDLLMATCGTLVAADHDAMLRSAGNAPRRRALALAAEALIRSQPDEVLSLANVCVMLHTSERTLQLAFQEHFGMGFQAYLRIMRLHQVRWSILQAGDRLSTTEIAMQHGFWHLGRFAQYYRQLFGCPPSETRRRAWGFHPGELIAIASPARTTAGLAS